ncbi:hypothetical protein KS4_11340 [Poriferisphaera corsica]|uniref:DUF5009 domain-containing protein n=1 Tax=Poriferisphaera corsica TaxID=2528020 RepID=A0A517YS97_9BACT|nr:hypothetical protein [Poriferisphaera corsica]QDU33092.1 hypothetical protein KS4_11340 [Poriferisphaera corsica]
MSQAAVGPTSPPPPPEAPALLNQASGNTNAKTVGGGGRVISIDALRGFIIIMMLFVNASGGVFKSQWWMGHLAAGKMGMALADFVFGSFLFITGLSIPFAFKKRLAMDAPAKLFWHIGLRVVSLLIIGHFMMGSPIDHIRYFSEINSGYGAYWDTRLWVILVFVSVFMIWHHVNVTSDLGRKISAAVRVLGAVGLGFAWWCFTVKDWKGDIGINFAPYWYGIVGLIGAAYLVAAVFYLLFRDNRVALVLGILTLFNVFFVVMATHEEYGNLRGVTAIYITLVSLGTIYYAIRGVKDAWADAKAKGSHWVMPTLFTGMGSLVVLFVGYMAVLVLQGMGTEAGVKADYVMWMPWAVWPMVMGVLSVCAVGWFVVAGQKAANPENRLFLWGLGAVVAGAIVYGWWWTIDAGWFVKVAGEVVENKLWAMTPIIGDNGGLVQRASVSTHATSAMLGLMMGLVIADNKKYPNPLDKITTIMTYALVCVVFALISAKWYGIHKNGAMPAYSLICAAFCMVMWVIFYLWIDVKGWKKWSVLFVMAGANPLTMYLIGYPVNAAFFMLDQWTWGGGSGAVFTPNVFNRADLPWFGASLDWSSWQPWIGVVKCLVWAFFTAWVVGMLAKKNFKLKL